MGRWVEFQLALLYRTPPACRSPRFLRAVLMPPPICSLSPLRLDVAASPPPRHCAEEAYCLPGLLPAVGRLANASVALLGPDYSFGSRPYVTCKAIINDMRALETGGGECSME